MRNGLGHAVLVTELLRDDGPFEAVAEDFVSERCTRCGEWGSEDMRFSYSGGFLCPQCMSALHAA